MKVDLLLKVLVELLFLFLLVSQEEHLKFHSFDLLKYLFFFVLISINDKKWEKYRYIEIYIIKPADAGRTLICGLNVHSYKKIRLRTQQRSMMKEKRIIKPLLLVLIVPPNMKKNRYKTNNNNDNDNNNMIE